MLWPVRLSFVCSRSATLVHPAQAVVIFGNVSRHLVRWPSTDIHEKVYEDRPTGSLPSGELNTTWVAKYRFWTSKAISRKRCEIGGKSVLITNRKSHMSFQLIPKSMTLNDLERRNGRYFALLHRIRVRCRRKTIIRPTSASKSNYGSL